MTNTDMLEEIIVGRVEPKIYTFETGTVPNYLKIGDTYRPVEERLKEWKRYYADLQGKKTWTAMVGDKVFFRDYAVHSYLESNGKSRLSPQDIPNLPYYSQEFFKDTNVDDVENAIRDIQANYGQNDIYQYYDVENRMPTITKYVSTGYWEPRPNQQEAIDRFIKAIKAGRTNLLLYAVMRFGKSFTAMCCAKAMAAEHGAKIVLVVSAKADVKEEWKKTVQSADNFQNYEFFDKKGLMQDTNCIQKTLSMGKNIVMFLTLQDLQGPEIKTAHKAVFDNQIDLLIIDETHFGARAEKYGAVLQGNTYEKDMHYDKDDDCIEEEKAEKQIKQLHAKVKLHLSGTPYRILMGGEFEKEDIISFCQYSDIIDAQKQWDLEHLETDNKGQEIQEWDNPYYGFPKMIRFAFNPNASAQKKLAELKQNGVTYAFSALLKSVSLKKDNKGNHKKFVYETEVLDLFRVIDGSQTDDNIFSFLNYDKIKDGQMCRHIVCVLPYCASCDALETLLKDHKAEFTNLKDYEIINISGFENQYKKVIEIKNKIKTCEANNQKTLTLTVNRMLTGSTVEQWDTMIYLKDTSSPQEYDQAIFRLQNQYIKTLKNAQGDSIKYNMKPQTLLVDFGPNRMFIMQEAKSQIYNVNMDSKGNADLEKRLQTELALSPIFCLNQDKMVRVAATDILQAVSQYSQSRSILDETMDIPVDLSLLEDAKIREEILKQAEIGTREGLKIQAVQGEETDLTTAGAEENHPDKTEALSPTEENFQTDEKNKKDETESMRNKFRTYYSRLLFFAFLSKDNITSLTAVINNLNNGDNRRIADNLSLQPDILILLRQHMNSYALQVLDYKIQNINHLANDRNLSPIDRALTAIKKFNRLSDSEVMTPQHICQQMVDAFPRDVFTTLKSKQNVILDIASKFGEFALAIFEKCKTLKIEQDMIKGAILSIPTSSVAYEFTRRIYEILGLDIACIAKNFTSYDLLTVKKDNGKKIDYEKITRILSQNKDFQDIQLTDNIITEGNKMKFSAVIGNPPYQEAKGKTKTQTQGNSTWIYPSFQFIADNMAEYSCLIYPFGGWFDSPERLEGLGQQILTDRHTVFIRAYEGTSDKRAWYRNDKLPQPIFGSNANLSAGVSIVFRDSKIHSDFIYLNRMYSDKEVGISFENAVGLPPNPVFIDINQRLGRERLNDRIRKGLFGIESDFVERNPTLVSFNRKDWKDPIRLLTNDRSGSAGRTKLYWTDRNIITKGQEFVDYFKVIMTSAYPKQKLVSGNSTIENVKKRSKELIEMLPNNSAFGRSRLSLFMSQNQNECENFIKYTQTHFFAGLVLQEPNRSSSFGLIIPDQDFTSHSDIDWSKSVPEIDQQLYEKYGFNEEEINFIEKHVKEM